jgi:hypothetical protein
VPGFPILFREFATISFVACRKLARVRVNLAALSVSEKEPSRKACFPSGRRRRLPSSTRTSCPGAARAATSPTTPLQAPAGPAEHHRLRDPAEAGPAHLRRAAAGLDRRGRGTEVYCYRIPRDYFEDKLVPVFAAVGRIYELRLMIEFSGTHRTYCYVRYCEERDAAEAVRLPEHHPLQPRDGQDLAGAGGLDAEGGEPAEHGAVRCGAVVSSEQCGGGR